MGELIPVAEAARRLRVSPGRVRQRIQDGSLAAEFVAGRWLLASDALEVAPACSRPLSPRIGWGLIEYLAYREADNLSRREKARIRTYAERLRDHPDPALLLRSWLRRRADRHRFRTTAGHLSGLGKHLALKPSGLSCDLSGMTTDVLEGYVRFTDFVVLVEQFLLEPAQRNSANVVLHVVPGEFPAFLEESGVPWSLIAADLADYAAPPHSARAANLVREHAR